MKKYIGTKIIDAKPMSSNEYNFFRGWPETETDLPGYLVEYLDGGYTTWLPAAVFEHAYCPIDGGMSFYDAVVFLKLGVHLARAGWNGMYLQLVPGRGVSDPLLEHVVDNKNTPWVASQADILAEDWYVVEWPVDAEGHIKIQLN